MRNSTGADRALERWSWPLFLSLCRRDAAEPARGPTSRPPPDPAAWECALRLAARHGVLGLALARLDRDMRLSGGSTPEISAVLSRLPKLRVRATLIEMRRDIVSTTLRKAGLDPVMLKGAALVGPLYRDPVERDILDIDVLVEEADVKVAVRALAAAGYSGPSSRKELWAFRRHHFHIPMESPNSPAVEVHWTLSRTDVPFRLDEKAVRDRAVDLMRPGLPALRVPSPEHMLLHFVLQSVQEGFTRLGRIVDIDRIVASTPTVDWSSFASDARRGNLGSAAAMSLELAGRLLGTRIPEGVLPELRPGPTSRVHLSRLHSLRPCPAAIVLGEAGRQTLRFWLLPTARARLLMLLAQLRPASALPSLKPRPGMIRRAVMLGKMAAVQAWASASLPLALATQTGRAEARRRSLNSPSSRGEPTRR